MKSSDQRYRHVQRYKRDPGEWEQWSKALVLALRDVRLGEGSFDAVASAIRSGSAEWDHLLLACGRTATAFHENFRRGSPGHHTIRANDLCPVEVLAGAKLDGFSVLRLSREQTKNVKLRWAKLREQDILIHDPQGTFWTQVVGCMIDGHRDEHLGLLEDLRERGLSLVLHNQGKDEDHRDARQYKEIMRLVAQPDKLFADQERWSPEKCLLEATQAFYYVKRLIKHGFLDKAKQEVFTAFVPYHDSPAEWRLDLERKLVIAEAFADGKDVVDARYNPDTSKRHTRYQSRLDRVERLAGAVFKVERDRVLAERAARRASSAA